MASETPNLHDDTDDPAAPGRRLPAPGLYVVSTPIGAARDITLRALDVLATADVIAAEDTRNTRRLMEIHAIPLGRRPLLAYHDHNGAAQRPRLLAELAEGRIVALVSDAGTPLVADPGFQLVRAALAQGTPVRAVPGPSAPLAALAVSGLPTDRFFFGGFLPSTKTARRTALSELAAIPGTLIFFESPHRLSESLADMADMLGRERDAAVARELTKKFEEVRRAPLGELANMIAAAPPRGEIVVMVGPAPERVLTDADIRELLISMPEGLSRRDAVAQVSRTLGAARKRVYAIALTLEEDS